MYLPDSEPVLHGERRFLPGKAAGTVEVCMGDKYGTGYNTEYIAGQVVQGYYEY